MPKTSLRVVNHVRCAPPCGADRLEKQAAIYGHMLAACRNHTGVCTSFATWGFSDRHTWLWHFLNPQGVNEQPLLFDLQYAPKPAFGALLAAPYL